VIVPGVFRTRHESEATLKTSVVLVGPIFFFRTRHEPAATLKTSAAFLGAHFFPQQWQRIGSLKINMSLSSMTTLQGMKGDQQKN